jgi:hypothetical protein
LVIQHVYNKYGRRGAAMTANVITYRGRSAVREVGKAFGFPEEMIGPLTKSISHYGVSDFGEMVERFEEHGFDMQNDLRTRKFVELYTRILDFPRHLGQHSGGMVISLGRLDGVVPIEPASMVDRTIIQWDKDDCERLGIVKVDLLGLGNDGRAARYADAGQRGAWRRGGPWQDTDRRPKGLQDAAGRRHDRDVPGGEPRADKLFAAVKAAVLL